MKAITKALTLFCCVLVGAAALAAQVTAQVTWDDYQRAINLRTKYQGTVLFEAGPANWIEKTGTFWYRRSVEGGGEFLLVDAKTASKRPAFDHEKLAVSLSTAASEKYTAVTLPFQTFSFADNQSAITFTAKGSNWRCALSDYACRKTGAATPGPGARGGGGPEDEASSPEGENDVFDGMVNPQQGQRPGAPGAAAPTFKTSPDGKSEAVIQNFNVFLRTPGKTDAHPLSMDGSEGNAYTLQSLTWSPDSTHIAVYRVRPGYRREVYYVESSPNDQLQPKHYTTTTRNLNARDYNKPGDPVDIAAPVLFDVVAKRQINIDNRLFPNPYSLLRPEWHKDSRAFTFEYNQRGHQVYRLIEVDAQSGAPRALISEETSTFIYYNRVNAGGGRTFRQDVNDGKEIVWMSERDGWAHLYLYDGLSGGVKNQITKGPWVVRAVDKVDEQKRQIWFQASGMYPGKDPYYVYAYKINLDGSGLTLLTEGEGTHSVIYSPDMSHVVDSWSRVDLAPVTVLRDASTGKVLMDLERADAKKLVAAGWNPPEAFAAPGRDGKTEIWGVIFRPHNLDPKKKYPVIEAIYAGPQGSFVPKTFGRRGAGPNQPPAFLPNMQPFTELGFIVVQIDGMGTSNRSKAFHDVAFKNLKDAGFPDRILWMKAAAAKYSYMDLTRVGIFGTSAGGQNALGGLLFHPEFYKAGSANSGCHDNRMDKIWWNEQWMSWPLGPQYAESSNVDNAYRLKGKLQLVVPELDTNVDPSSTMQVVNALMKANKKFDLLVVPGGDHGAGGRFAQRLMFDFFIHSLMGVEPPEWQAPTAAEETATERVPN